MTQPPACQQKWLLPALWRDQRGAMASTEMIMMGTVVILGAIVGLAGFRDAVVQELGDVSAATAELNHGYRFAPIEQDDVVDTLRYSFLIGGSTYVDNLDYCVPGTTDPVGLPPMCILIRADEIQDEQ